MKHLFKLSTHSQQNKMTKNVKSGYISYIHSFRTDHCKFSFISMCKKFFFIFVYFKSKVNDLILNTSTDCFYLHLNLFLHLTSESSFLSNLIHLITPPKMMSRKVSRSFITSGNSNSLSLSQVRYYTFQC
jgi:hypothetical protein